MIIFLFMEKQQIFFFLGGDWNEMRSLLAADQSFRKYGKNFQLYFATTIALEKLKKKKKSEDPLSLSGFFCSSAPFLSLFFLFLIFCLLFSGGGLWRVSTSPGACIYFFQKRSAKRAGEAMSFSSSFSGMIFFFEFSYDQKKFSLQFYAFGLLFAVLKKH